MYMKNLRQAVNRIEELILSVLLTGLIVLSCLQIALRLFFDSGMGWADPLLRYMVVWCGLLGALLAVSQNKHITIDLSGYLLPRSVNEALEIITGLFSGLICSVLGYASWLFIRSEMEFGGPAFLSIPSWGWNIIFFITFGLMALRYFISSASTLCRLLFSKQPVEGQPRP